jgi:teichuronic acid biosynthesis glycosyltransferase TuaG
VTLESTRVVPPPSDPTLPAPTVSVIMPAHNAARFLDEAIGSVAAQTFTDWEMIVVDDDSADSTRAIVERWAASDRRIRLVRQSPQQGAAAARNRALAETRGRYVAFLDSDDLWRPEKLEAQVAFMRETGAVFSFAGYSVIDERGRPMGRAVRAPERVDYRFLLRNTIIGCLTVMLDRSRLGPLRMPSHRQHEDLSLWYELLKRGVVAMGIPRDLALYRVVRGSASRNKLRSALDMWRVYRDQERLSLPSAVLCYAQYAWNAFRKNPI